MRRFLAAAEASGSRMSSDSNDSMSFDEQEHDEQNFGEEFEDVISESAELQSDDENWESDNDDISSIESSEGVLEVDKIRDVFKKHNLSRACMTDFLGILRHYDPSLPRDPRTIMKTPRSVAIHSRVEGEYVFYDFAELVLSFEKLRDVKLLQISSDGIPIFRSNPRSPAWIVSFRLWSRNLQTKPFVIAVFVGKNGKPDRNFLYHKLVPEVNKILEQCPYIRVVFVCDAQARSFTKGIVAHNHTFGCERCKTEGEWDDL